MPEPRAGIYSGPSARPPWGRLFFISVGLIIYGSLFPFHFHSRLGQPSAVWVFLHNWPPSFDYYLLKDAVINLLLYIPIGLFGALWIGKGKPDARSALLSLLIGFALSLSMELLQAYDDSRSCSIADLLMNEVSTALGVLLLYLYGTSIRKLVHRMDLYGTFEPSGPSLILLFWVARHGFPFFPQFSASAILSKLHTLGGPGSLSLLELAGAIIDCLSVARMLEGVIGPHMTRRFLFVVFLILPAQILIYTKTVAWPDLLGSLFAWIIWTGWFWRWPRRTAVLAWLSAALLLVRGLAPYHWSATPTAFSWIPFSNSLGYEYGSALIPFLNKGFLYAAAVRLFVQAGSGYLRPTIGLAVLLGAIEAAQTHLPGRTPEISDPLYLILLAIILKLLDSGDSMQQGVVSPNRINF